MKRCAFITLGDDVPPAARVQQPAASFGYLQQAWADIGQSMSAAAFELFGLGRACFHSRAMSRTSARYLFWARSNPTILPTREAAKTNSKHRPSSAQLTAAPP